MCCSLCKQRRCVYIRRAGDGIIKQYKRRAGRSELEAETVRERVKDLAHVEADMKKASTSVLSPTLQIG